MLLRHFRFQGQDYDVPENEIPAVPAVLPDAKETRRYRDSDGRDYDVPDDEREAFHAVMQADGKKTIPMAHVRDTDKDGNSTDHYVRDYGALLANPDFAEMSAYKTTANGKPYKFNAWANRITETGFNDVLYDAINGNPEAIDMSARVDTFDNFSTHKGWMGLPDDVKGVFNYLYATESPAEAYKFLRSYKSQGYTGIQSAAAGVVKAATLNIPKLITGDKTLDEVQAANPDAGIVGEGFGTLFPLIGIGKVFSAVPWLSKLPALARAMTTSAAAFGTSTAISGAGDVRTGDKSVGQYAGDVAASAAGGAVGGAAAALTGAAAGAFLKTHGLAQNVLARSVANGLTGAAFGAGDSSTKQLASWLQYPDDYKPDGKQILMDSLVGFAFGMLSGIGSEDTSQSPSKSKSSAWSKWFSEDMSYADMEKAYRNYAKKYHPDIAAKNGIPAAEAAAAMAEINAAHDALKAFMFENGLKTAANSYREAATSSGEKADLARAKFSEDLKAVRSLLPEDTALNPGTQNALQILGAAESDFASRLPSSAAGIKAWAAAHPKEAQSLLATQGAPSRSIWEKAGLPRVSADERLSFRNQLAAPSETPPPEAAGAPQSAPQASGDTLSASVAETPQNAPTRVPDGKGKMVEASAPRAPVSSPDGKPYTWRSLSSAKPIPLSSFKRGAISASSSLADMVSIGKESVRKAGGHDTDRGLVLNIPSFGDVVVVGKRGIQHGLRPYAKYKDVYDKENADILPALGDILKNSIPVNEQFPDGTDSATTGSTILLGAAKDDSDSLVPVVSVVLHNRDTNPTPPVYVYPLKSLNAKGRESDAFDTHSGVSGLDNVSVANLVDLVKEKFPVFSKDVYDHFGIKRPSSDDYDGLVHETPAGYNAEGPGQIDSSGTSLNQLPSGTKKAASLGLFKEGGVNLDIGGGKSFPDGKGRMVHKGTEFLKGLGVENRVVDPFSQPEDVNRESLEATKGGLADTATVNNVLNTISSDENLDAVVHQAARAIKPDGTAIFSFYEGDKSGVGKKTPRGYQRNLPTKAYLPFIEKHFGEVEMKNGVILARKPLRGEAVNAMVNKRGDSMVYETPGIYTGTAADYANRSRQGGKDDGPSLLKIGTGEGAQVYGWGLYGSGVRGVAEGYANSDRAKKNLARRPNDIFIDGQKQRNTMTPEGTAADAFDKAEGDRGKAAAELREHVSRMRGWLDSGKIKGPKIIEMYRRMIARDQGAIRLLEDKSKEFSRTVNSPTPRAVLYEQTFFTDRAPGDESHLLKWYEPVSEEQVRWIADAWFKENPTQNPTSAPTFRIYALRERDGEFPTGAGLYQVFSDALGSPQAASEFLARAGIDGIKYPVDSFGGKGVKDGDEVGWNYVSFSDEHIRVDHKWVEGEQVYETHTPWSPKFEPKSVVHTNLETIQKLPGGLFDKAKHGDAAAAAEIVERVVKPDKIAALAKRHPNAIVVPVHAEEASGRNQLPNAFAKHIGKLTNLPVELGIAQSVHPGHTGASELHRLVAQPEFDGPVQPGRDYILVDDHLTSGGTLNALRDYIQLNGGNVVEFSSLTASRFATIVAPKKATLDALRAKHPDVDQVLKDLGLADSADLLPEKQLHTLKGVPSGQLRARLSDALRDVRKTQSGGTGGNSLHAGRADSIRPLRTDVQGGEGEGSLRPQAVVPDAGRAGGSPAVAKRGDGLSGSTLGESQAPSRIREDGVGEAVVQQEFNFSASDVEAHAKHVGVPASKAKDAVSRARKAADFAAKTKELYAKAFAPLPSRSDLVNAINSKAADLGNGIRSISRIIREHVKTPDHDMSFMKGAQINNSADLASLLMAVRSPYQEMIKVVYTDRRLKVLDAQIVAYGSLDRCPANPRDIFRDIPDNATGFFLSHNHPSGDPTPSREDVSLTERIEKAGDLFGLRLHDHVITNGEKFTSLRDFRTHPVPNAKLADWEVVASGSTSKIRDPDIAANLASIVRQNGDSLVVLGLDTKNALTSISLFPGDFLKSLSSSSSLSPLFNTLSRSASSAFALVGAPDGLFSGYDSVLATIADSARSAGFRFLDFIHSDSDGSFRSSSRGDLSSLAQSLFREDAAPYDGETAEVNEVRESLVSREQIVQNFRDRFPDVKIGSRVVTQDMGTDYDPDTKSIRTRDYDIAEISRMLGVHLYYTTASGSLPPAVATALKASSKTFEDGMGKAVENLLLSKPVDPVVADWLNGDWGDANPEARTNLERMRFDISRFQSMTPEERVRAFHDVKRPNAVVSATHWARQALSPHNWVDKNYFLLQGMRDAKLDVDLRDPNLSLEERALRIKTNPYLLATAFQKTSGLRIANMALDGTTDLLGQRVTGPSLHAALAPVAGKDYKTFLDYAVARVAQTYHNRGLESGIDAQDANAVVSKLETPEFKQALDDVTDWSRKVMHLLVDTGVMSRADYSAIVGANDVYLPFMRRFLEGDLYQRKAYKNGKAIHERVGGMQNIENPIEALLLSAQRQLAKAQQAEIVRACVATMEMAPNGSIASKWMEEIPAPTSILGTFDKQIEGVLNGQPISADLQDILADYGLHLSPGATPAELQNFAKTAKIITTAQVYDGRHQVASVMIDGKRRWFQVNDPHLADLLNGYSESQEDPLLLAAARKLTNLVRFGATMMNPKFGLIRNPIRDTCTAFLFSDYHNHLPGLSLIHGLVKDLAGGKYANLYSQMGLTADTLSAQTMNQAHDLAGQTTARNWFERAWRRGLLRTTASLLSITESAPRLLEFEGAYKHWMGLTNDPEAAGLMAACASADLTVNFRRAGKTGERVSQFVLFANAGIQSIDKLGREMGVLSSMPWEKDSNRFKRFGRTLLRAGGLLTLTSLLSYLRYRDDDDWKNLTPYEKYSYFHFREPVTGSMMRLPLPFEPGLLFGSLPIAICEQVSGRNPKAVEECLGIMANQLPFSVGGIHAILSNFTALAPLVDILANCDYKDSPIVPPHTRDSNEPVNWYTTKTSEAAKKTGELLWPVVKDTGLKEAAAPAYIDHVLNSYSGGLFKSLLSALDDIADPSGIDAGGDLSTLPLFGTLFTPPSADRRIGDFYDRMDVLQRKLRSKSITPEELGEYRAMQAMDGPVADALKARREAMADKTKNAGERHAEALQHLREARDAVQKFLDTTNPDDYKVAGAGSAVWALTNPSCTDEQRADNLKIVEGMSEKQLVQALQAHARKRGMAIRTHYESMQLTPYGKRYYALKKLMREVNQGQASQE